MHLDVTQPPPSREQEWPQGSNPALRGCVGCAQPALRGAPSRRGLGAVGTPMESWGYAAAALLGAGLGGALIGFVAADSKDGAVKGAAFASGLAGVSDGVATWAADPEERFLSVALIVGGLGGMFYAIRSRLKRVRR